MQFFPILFSVITGAESWIEDRRESTKEKAENDETKRKTVRLSATFHCSYNPYFTIFPTENCKSAT